MSSALFSLNVDTVSRIFSGFFGTKKKSSFSLPIKTPSSAQKVEHQHHLYHLVVHVYEEGQELKY